METSDKHLSAHFDAVSDRVALYKLAAVTIWMRISGQKIAQVSCHLINQIYSVVLDDKSEVFSLALSPNPAFYFEVGMEGKATSNKGFRTGELMTL